MMTEDSKARLEGVGWFFKLLSCRQFLPSKEDLECEDTKELSKRLMGDSYKETLTNIVEWQEKNIQYWHERADMFLLLYLLSSVSLCFIPLSSYVGIFLIIVIFLMCFLNFMLFVVGVLFLITEVIVVLSVVIPYIASIPTIIEIVVLSTTFGGIISLLLYTMLKYRYLKASQPEFRLEDTFKSSLSVKKILRYRLAICRDYAKISAALLLISYYPSNKIYFITIPQHVAAAIKIRDKMYVLDQRLPVLTIEKWMDFWSRRMSKSFVFKFSSFLSRIFKGGEVGIYELVVDGGRNIKMKEADCQKLGKVTATPQVDVEYLMKMIAYDMAISQNLDKKAPDLEINLKNFAACYYRDEIVEFSLLKAIKNKLESELCENLRKIKGIKITQNQEDLVLGVYIS
jgi:predicted transglutaminase-like protease